MKKRCLALLLGIVTVLGVTLVAIDPPQTHAASNRYIKTSVDNTALFVYTDTQTGCKFVYDSIHRTIRVAKGYERCKIPATLE